MKELLRLLSNVFNFFTEKRFINQNVPKAAPQADEPGMEKNKADEPGAEKILGTPKPKIDLTGKGAREAMLAQAEVAAAAVTKSLKLEGKKKTPKATVTFKDLKVQAKRVEKAESLSIEKRREALATLNKGLRDALGTGLGDRESKDLALKSFTAIESRVSNLANGLYVDRGANAFNAYLVEAKKIIASHKSSEGASDLSKKLYTASEDVAKKYELKA